MVRRLLALLAIASLSACEAKVQSGMVKSKDYDPESQYTTFMCASYNPSGICTVQVPQFHATPECWRLKLRNDSGKEGEICTSKSTWESTEVGSWFPSPTSTEP